MTGPTMALAEFCAGLRFEQLPSEVVSAARDHILDSVGCILSGSEDRDIKRVARAMQRLDSDRSIRIWGTDLHASLPTAVTCHAAMAHAWDADDAHKVSMGHPGTVVVPVALGLGGALRRSGREVVTAVAAGYEAVCRVGAGVGITSHRERGWYPTSTFGSFGAAAAAGWLLGLDARAMANALGLAGSSAGGLWNFAEEGAMVKKLYPGRAARLGLESAILASEGFTGPTRVLESADGGFYRAVSDQPQLEAVTEGLGDRFLLPEVSIKPYVGSRTTHAAIDGCLAIAGRAGLEADQVERVVVRTYAVAKRQADLRPPYPSVSVALVSVPFCVAVALLDRAVFPAQLSGDRLNDPRVLALADRVQMVVDPEMDRLFPEKWSCVVEVYARGERYEETVDAARGDPTRPLTAEDLRRKFICLARMGLPAPRAEVLYESLVTLTDQPNMRAIADMVAGEHVEG